MYAIINPPYYELIEQPYLFYHQMFHEANLEPLRYVDDQSMLQVYAYPNVELIKDLMTLQDY